MMFISKKLLFSVVLGLCITGSVFAQKGDKNRPPDKGKPPVVVPKDKPPPSKEDKPKKPDFAIVLWRSAFEENA